MTDRLPLRDNAASRAVLMGTWSYQHLPPLPAARHSLNRMTRLLTGELCDWPATRVSVLRNQNGAAPLADKMITLFEDVTDVALFYFVGHGQMAESDHGTELCLGLTGSRLEAHRRASTSLPFRAMRDALRYSAAATKIVILDCCYSGLATLPHNTLGPGLDVVDTATIAGTYILAASAPDSTAWYETDTPTPQTYFTKYLADTVETGIPGEGEVLRARTLYTQVRTRLAEDGRPVPIERNVNAAHDLGFAYNPTPSATITLEGPSKGHRPNSPTRRRWRIAVLAAAAAAVLTVSVTLLVVLPGSGASSASDNSGFAWTLPQGGATSNGSLVGLWSTTNSMVVGTIFGGLTAYDPTTGQQQWHWQPPNNDQLCNMSPTWALGSTDGRTDGIAAFDYGPNLTCNSLQTISVFTGKLHWARPISIVGRGASPSQTGGDALSFDGDYVSAPFIGSADPNPGTSAPDTDVLGAFLLSGKVLFSTNYGQKPMPDGCQLTGSASVLKGSFYTIGVCGGQDWVLEMDLAGTPTKVGLRS